MGWSSIYVGKVSNKNQWMKDFFHEEWERFDEFELVDYARKGSVVYMAIKHLGAEKIFAMVTLTSFNDGEFYWKYIEESFGPVYVECPQRILKKLTPTEDQYAKSWREKCWEYHKKNKTRKYQHGQVLKFPNKIAFTNGFEGDSFILIKEGRKFSFVPYNGQTNTKGLAGLYRITKWRQKDPKIIKTLN